MARRRNSNRGRSAPRRRMFWARRAELSTLNADGYAFSHDLLQDFQDAYSADLFGFTVTRVVGHFTWWASAQTVATTFNLSMGLRVDDSNQVQSVPADQRVGTLPIRDPFVDWMWVRNNGGATVGETDAPALQMANNRVELDLRSQRRLDELGQSLYLFHGLNTPIEGEDIFLWYDLHILCKRP